MKYFVIWSHVDCEDNKEGYLTESMVNALMSNPKILVVYIIEEEGK